ncbi:MAG: hypothetical protein KIG43_06160 [Eubacteriales bacterium]|nr:hypothetical protein [Eubacteriales bacterium]MCI7570652.1 hypothetical protein [Clostridiales bacterium]MDD7551265.1 hypothetical protein [Clostridia bacterium]MDY5754403.1 hypothetical protein [Eubacteriales bacterium]
MKTWMFIAGVVTGTVMAASALSSMYPDVPKRIMRDSKRTLRSACRATRQFMR